MTSKQIAQTIPSEYRKKILLEWLPNSTPTLSNLNFKLLFETYYIYIDPDGVKKPNCQACINQVFENWKSLMPALIDAEKEENALNFL